MGSGLDCLLKQGRGASSIHHLPHAATSLVSILQFHMSNVNTRAITKYTLHILTISSVLSVSYMSLHAYHIHIAYTVLKEYSTTM